MNYGTKNGFGPQFESTQSTEEKNAHLYGVQSAPEIVEEPVVEPEEETASVAEESAAEPADIAEPAEQNAEEQQAAEAEEAPVTNAKKTKKGDKKKEEKKEKGGKKKKRNTAYIVFKVFVFIIFGAMLVLYGIGRAEEANKLIGKTQLPTQSPSDTIPDVNIGDDQNTNVGYNYINIENLEKMSANDLAMWYMKEFGRENVNEAALAEFNNWYAVKIAQDNTFDIDYQAALAYIKANPGLLNPTPVEKPTEPATPSETPTEGTEKPDGEKTETTPDGDAEKPADGTGTETGTETENEGKPAEGEAATPAPENTTPADTDKKS